MCRYCGVEDIKSEDERAENIHLVNPESCKFCSENQYSGLLKQGGMNRLVTPSLTPTTSLWSSEPSFSSDFSVDATPCDGGNEEECSSGSSSSQDDKSDHGETMRDVDISSDQELEHDTHHIEALIWEPPEPENLEDELEDISDIDEDDDSDTDEDDDGKSRFLEESKDENYKGLGLKGKKRRTTQEATERKFKDIVSQLLKSVGVSSTTANGENWIDIVTGLSWEAASLLMPVVIDGKSVDPNVYVKVKCIATGSRNDSQLFRGLVFKKHAAHKHMPTKYEHPRILLVEGVLGHSTSGLSSFISMAQETNYVKPVEDLIEVCHPNVILVEKSVCRDVQGAILNKGITLVSDMKLHRLERIARCIGSSILSFNTLSLPIRKLKHCDSFRIEKIAEEHNIASEGGKIPSKTLMFLEGCPTRLGYTILLKGGHSDELKRVKEVVQYAVVLAHHLILEMSFLIDQQTMLSTVSLDEEIDSALETKSSITEITISDSNGNGKENGDEVENCELDGDSVFTYAPYNPAILVGLSSLSASIKKVLEANRLSKYFHLVGSPKVVPASVDDDMPDALEAVRDSAEDTAEKDGKNTQFLSVESEDRVSRKVDDGDEVQIEKDTETALDSQSILVLVSRRNAIRGIICEQNHFSRLMFYKNFDVPLGKFLHDMFNQGSQCNTCGELPEAHVYYYAHRSKQLTIQIKRIPSERILPGEAKGKLWMWSHCGKCKTRNGGTLKATKRVMISTASRSLSFGKFLELSFSQQSLLSGISSCGHCFDKDFCHFFGLGSMVAMFRYSEVLTYNVSLPPQKLELGKSIKAGWLEREFQYVFTKGISLLEEVASSLKHIRSKLTSSSPKNQSLSDIEDMLKEERYEFEGNIKNAFDKTKTSDDVSHKLLGLNCLRWELLLQALVWDRRLHSLALPNWPTDRKKPELGFKVKSDDLDVARAKSETNGKASDSNGSFQGDETVYDRAEESNDQEVDRTIPISRESRSHVLARAHINDWFWLPFEELRSRGIKDLEVYLSKSDSATTSSQEILQTMNQIIHEEGSRQHITLGDDHSIVSDYEDELSSLIACALAHLANHPNSGDSSDEELKRPLTRSKHGSLEGFLDKDPSNSRFLKVVRRKVSFGWIKSHEKSKYTVVCIYADKFRELRELCCSSELSYIASLSRCKPWDAKGGKSKSPFAKTLDDRFVVKEIKRTEYESFVKFADQYFTYMMNSYKLGNKTCLAKVLGIYQVTIRQGKSGKERRHNLMVMENLNFGRKMRRQYDLKGALHARFTTSDGSEDVLLDQNFVSDMNNSPHYVTNTSKRTLQRAVWNDTAFLNSINVMDYSLLVGVEEEGREMACGIIDYLRQYTWDKKLETWVKSSLVVPKNMSPTIITPKDYKHRFRKFLSTHFLSVPDEWSPP